MSAEHIYNLIEEQGTAPSEQSTSRESSTEGSVDEPSQPKQGERQPNAPATPGAFGQVLDAPEPKEDDGGGAAEQAREWKIAVGQAENVARLAGKLPAGVTRSLEQSEAAGVDWRELLRRAWSETIPSDYSWMPPNRRHIWAGVYLPGFRCGGAGEIEIGRAHV